MICDYHILISILLKKIRKVHEERKVSKAYSSCSIEQSINDVSLVNKQMTLKDKIKYETKFRLIWDMSSILLEHETQGIRIKKAKISKISDYAIKTICIEPGRERNICIPEYFEKTSEQIITYNSPDINIYVLNNTHIVGQTHLILNQGQDHLLNELFYTSGKRADLSYGYLISTRKNTVYYATESNSVKIDKGIYLINPANYNYYHFLYETLTRLIVSDELDIYRNWPILIDECVKTIPNLSDLLEIIRGSHDIIWIKKNRTYFVAELVYPDTYYWMPGNILKGEKSLPKDYIMSTNILFKLKETLSVSSQENEDFRKIFISRKNMTMSRLSNEKEIEELFRNAGFTIIYPETMTIHEQITAFHSAEFVVGASGGALSNILFCKPRATIICIIPEVFHFYMYSTIAKELYLNVVFLDAFITSKTPYIATDIYTLDLEYAKRFIDKFFSDTV